MRPLSSAMIFAVDGLSDMTVSDSIGNAERRIQVRSTWLVRNRTELVG